jgi:hypothetical protein
MTTKSSTILSSETLATEQAFQGHARKALIVLQQFHHMYGMSGTSELGLRTITDELCKTMVRLLYYSYLLTN